MSITPIQLSKNFTSAEFVCRCCAQFVVDQALVNALQLLRDAVGPLHITCAYRCNEHNKAVGGEDGSLHTLGRAADVVATNVSLVKLYEAALKIEAFQTSGIGLYPERGFMHVDVKRSKPARWAHFKKQGYVAIERALKEQSK